MGTPLKEVYNAFLDKIKDYNVLSWHESGELDGILFGYLKSSIIRFTVCEKDLAIIEVPETITSEVDGVITETIVNVKYFNSDLDMTEVEILSMGMLLSYTYGKTMEQKNLELILSEQDSTKTSAHLGKLTTLKSVVQSDFSHLMNMYSLRSGLEDLS